MARKNNIQNILDELRGIERELPDAPDVGPLREDIVAVRGRLNDLDAAIQKAQGKIDKQMEDFPKLTQQLEQDVINLRSRVNSYESQPRGGGAPNRQISINSSVIGNPYNDFNFIGSIAGIPNTQTRQTDVYFSGGSGGGTPADPDTSVQFNDSGSFGGDAALEWNKTDNILKISENISGGAINFGPSLTSSSYQITVINQTAIDADGDDLQITGATGNGAGIGGGVEIHAGFDGDGNTSGASLDLSGGATVDGHAGNASLGAGSADLVGNGGNAGLSAGDGGQTSGSGGSLSITAGSAQGGDSFGGDITETAGNSSGARPGGNFTLVGGRGGDSSGGNGGYFALAGGNAGTGSAGNGGIVQLQGGQADGAGQDGRVYISDASNGQSAILDTSLLASSDKTFSFPNTTGTLGLKNQEIAQYGVGTAYTFTNSATAIDFGTTDPVITLNAAGTYLIFGQVNLAYNGATVTTETATIKVRRTNNTAADLSAVVVLDLPVTTLVTNTYGIFQIPPFVYTTAATDDSVTIFGNVSAGLGAGTIDATAIGTSLVAIRLY